MTKPTVEELLKAMDRITPILIDEQTRFRTEIENICDALRERLLVEQQFESTRLSIVRSQESPSPEPSDEKE